MTTIRKPMRAPNDLFDDVLAAGKVQWPMLGSFKLDGWRATIQGGTILTSSGSPILNAFTQRTFGHADFEGLDGELIVGPWNAPKVFWTTQTAMKREHGEPDVRLYLFDDFSAPSRAFAERFQRAQQRVAEMHATKGIHARVEWIPQVMLEDEADLAAFELTALQNHFEGVMIKRPDSVYKFGRATVNEGTMFKVKRFTFDEAKIVGFKEQMANENEAFLGGNGQTKRSERREGLTGTGMVGSFEVLSPKWPEPFMIGAGSLSHDEKKAAFERFNELYANRIARFKHFEHGSMDAPRHGIFDALRDPSDIASD